MWKTCFFVFYFNLVGFVLLCFFQRLDRKYVSCALDPLLLQVLPTENAKWYGHVHSVSEAATGSRHQYTIAMVARWSQQVARPQRKLKSGNMEARSCPIPKRGQKMQGFPM